MHKNIFLFLIIFFVVIQDINYSQTEDIRIGADLRTLRQTQGALFDYSDPETINIKVAVWGFVRYPGRYIIPGYSNVRDLLSYAGGPTDAANLDDLRIFRVEEDSTETLIKFDYNDLLWEKDFTRQIYTPELMPGDILLVPGEPRLYFKDYFSITLSVVSTLISLSILILNIVRK